MYVSFDKIKLQTAHQTNLESNRNLAMIHIKEINGCVDFVLKVKVRSSTVVAFLWQGVIFLA